MGRLLAGNLNRRIVIQSNTTSRDTDGASLDSWGTLATVWAERVPIAGAEEFAADQITALADVRFRIRYRSDVTTKNRLTHGGITYDIVQVAEIELQEGLDLFCKARVNG